MVAWLPYVWVAVVIAATAGFGYGAAAFLAFGAGLPPGAWWTRLVEAHGHLQVFGWGGMMVLGVGFHFLPRLRGAPLALAGVVPWILGLLGGGFVLRGLFATAADPTSPLPFRLALAVSGVLEVCGATAAVVVLALTARRGPALRHRRGLVPVLPYLVLAFASFWVALAMNAIQMALVLLDGPAVVAPYGSGTVFLLGLEGFLVPVSVAVAARSFPLFLWLRVPEPAVVFWAFWPLLAGIALRAISLSTGPGSLAAMGSTLEGCSLVAIVVALGVVPLRRRNGAARESDAHYQKSAEYLLVPALAWLAFTGALQVGNGLAVAFLNRQLLPLDVEHHALGAGFVTLLILGMGQRMLPGFRGREISSRNLVWYTALLGNASALLRVGIPVVQASGWMPRGAVAWQDSGLAFSGLLGLVAVLLFGINLWRTFNARR